MTFAEVPVGHLFKLRSWDCDCFWRKTGEATFRYVATCDFHTKSMAKHPEVRIRTEVTPTSWLVRYDPFLAGVEALSHGQ